MDINKYMGLPTIQPADIASYAKDMNKDLASIYDARDKFFEKYLAQSPYKKGDKVLLKHRKYGIMKGKIDKIRVNELTGQYEYTFKANGKLIPSGHVISFQFL